MRGQEKAWPEPRKLHKVTSSLFENHQLQEKNYHYLYVKSGSLEL